MGPSRGRAGHATKPMTRGVSTPRPWITYRCRRKKNSGTRPKVSKTRPIAPRAPTRSSTAMNAIAGPRVISRKSSDGGFFVQFTNERAVSKGVRCDDQARGSP